MAEPGPWRVPVLRRPIRAEEHPRPVEQVARLRAERRPSDAPPDEVLDDRASLAPRAGLALKPPLVVWSGSGCVRVCFVRALVDLQPTSALVERRVRAYLHSSELDDFSYPWPDTQSGCQSVRVCKALRGGVRTSASTSRIG